jgi:hypothetical protein
MTLEENTFMRIRTNALGLITATLLVASMVAQPSPGSAQPDSAQTVVAPGFAGPQVKAGMVSLRVDNMDVAPVKGAPFCATIVTEHTQNFADGNRIHTTDNSTLCRDSEGRTRREAVLNLMGPVPQKSSTKLVTIVDPVAGFRYVLDASEKTARKMLISSLPGSASVSATGPAQGGYVAKARVGGDVVYQTADVAGPGIFFKKFGQNSDEPAPTTEDLGDQTIEGIHATGTRITTTIPSGSMGNDQPMTVTSERWYSPELKATVMTKHNDPWAGELKTQVANVNTAEPDRSLFTVPADYKIVDEKAGPFWIQGPPPLPPPPPQ